MNSKRGISDLWLLLAMVVVMWMVWYLSGGPNKFSTDAGPFIEPPPPLGSGRTYGRSFFDFSGERWVPNFSFSVKGPTLRERDREKQESISPASSANSSYQGQVKIKLGNARRELRPGEEYIVLQAGSRNTAPINISGWWLKNGKDQRFKVPNYLVDPRPVSGVSNIVKIPFGVKLFVLGGNNIPNEPVILEPGAEAVVVTGWTYSGSAPKINASFRVNRCSGYLGKSEDYNFVPSLSTKCPDPEDEPDIKFLDRECQDFVEGYGVCRTPEFKQIDGMQYVDDRNVDLNRQCRDYLAERFSYSTCVARHQHEPDFYEEDWRVYLGERYELWAEEDEVITLYDNFSKIVDEVSY